MSNRRQNIKRTGARRGIYLIPNLITTASLFCGFYSIVSAINEDFVTAAWAIFIAGIFDMLDGRIARITNTSSEFGIQYDSLCDLSSFGLAPVVLAYMWGLRGFERVGIAAAFIYFACGALRLARFNVQSSDVERKHFQGLPIPMAAGLLLTYVVFYQNLYGDFTATKSYVLLALTWTGALLMVSHFPYRSFKSFSSRRTASFFYLVVSAVCLTFFIMAPHEFVFITACLYALSGPLESLVNFIRRSLKGEELNALGGLAPSEEQGNEPLKLVHS